MLKILTDNHGDKLSKTSDTMRAVSNLVSFIKEKTAQNITEANQQGRLKTSREDTERIIQIVQDSIAQAYTLGVSTVERTLK